MILILYFGLAKLRFINLQSENDRDNRIFVSGSHLVGEFSKVVRYVCQTGSAFQFSFFCVSVKSPF